MATLRCFSKSNTFLSLQYRWGTIDREAVNVAINQGTSNVNSSLFKTSKSTLKRLNISDRSDTHLDLGSETSLVHKHVLNWLLNFVLCRPITSGIYFKCIIIFDWSFILNNFKLINTANLLLTHSATRSIKKVSVLISSIINFAMTWKGDIKIIPLVRWKFKYLLQK